MFQEVAAVIFAEPTVAVYVYVLKVLVAPFSPEYLQLPSLLGRDIIDRWRMICDKTRGELSFEIVTADMTVPIPAPPAARAAGP